MAKVVHIVNPTAVAFSAGPPAADVGPYAIAYDVTLTDAEFGLLFDSEKCLIIKATVSQAEKEMAAKVLSLGRNPGYSTLGQ